MECVIRSGTTNMIPKTEILTPDVDNNDFLTTKVALHGPEFLRENDKVYTIFRLTLQKPHDRILS